VPEVKVLHMADMHLEWPFAAMGAEGAKGRLRREELKAVFAGIIGLALSEAVQVLLLAGDLFEHAHAGRGLMKFIDQQFQRIPRTRVFISPGNHDPLLPNSYYLSYPWASNVHIFGPEAERVDLPDLPVSVYGWGFGAYEVRECHLAGLRAQDPARISLAVVHGGDEAYHPFRPADLAALGADYIALGHIHKEGVLLEQGGRVIARYSGSPEALGFGEPGEHGVYLGTVGKQENRLRFVPTGRRRYETLTVDVTGAESLEDVVARVLAVDEPDARRQHCYRLALTGAVEPGFSVDLSVLAARLANEFYFVKLADETRPDYDLAALARERSARGLFVQRLLAQEAAAPDGAARARIRRALTLGLEAFGRGGAR
jgi:DNA repair protein SbcD/Mre11